MLSTCEAKIHKGKVRKNNAHAAIEESNEIGSCVGEFLSISFGPAAKNALLPLPARRSQPETFFDVNKRYIQMYTFFLCILSSA